jgi:hypothetical protein
MSETMTMPASRADQRTQALQNAWRCAQKATVFQDLENTMAASSEAVIAQAWATIAATLVADEH